MEYAIKLPGQGDQEYVYLPIDSKFPLADYYRLEEAYETGDKDEIERCRKSLLASVKRFARDIRNKYIAPPRTTNFGVLFVPTEGLYSEIVRNPVFFDDLRREEQIIVAGPSTLSALLNSLSVGFKTLNIQECRPYQQDSCQCQDRVWQVWWYSGQGTKTSPTCLWQY